MDEAATDNAVLNNELINNGTVDNPDNPFNDVRADLTLLSFNLSNCYAGNSFSTFFSFFGFLPPCD